MIYHMMQIQHLLTGLLLRRLGTRALQPTSTGWE